MINVIIGSVVVCLLVICAVVVFCRKPIDYDKAIIERRDAEESATNETLLDVSVDSRIMWETVKHKDGEIRATQHAVMAAHRVFNSVHMKGMSRDAIFNLINMPTWYRPKFPYGSDSIGLRFDDGKKGIRIMILFDKGDNCIDSNLQNYQ